MRSYRWINTEFINLSIFCDSCKTQIGEWRICCDCSYISHYFQQNKHCVIDSFCAIIQMQMFVPSRKSWYLMDIYCVNQILFCVDLLYSLIIYVCRNISHMKILFTLFIIIMWLVSFLLTMCKYFSNIKLH